MKFILKRYNIKNKIPEFHSAQAGIMHEWDEIDIKIRVINRLLY